MTTHTAAGPAPTARRILGASAAAVALLVALWVIGTAIEAGTDRAPWGLLIVFVPPYLIGLALLRRAPRVAAALLAVLHLIFVVSAVVAFARDPFDMWTWAAYPFLVGVPVAVAGVVAAGRTLQGR